MPPSQPAFRSDVDVKAPMQTLRHSHDRIVDSLHALADLPQLVAQMRLARNLAATAADLFDGPLLEHHADEEQHLFPAVLASAHAGEEKEKAARMAQRLTGEHRALEQAWKAMAAPLRAIAAGKTVAIDTHALQRLIAGYTAHAAFEEDEYLPFAEEVLARDGNHMAAFGLSLHLAHVRGVPTGHI
jgi:hemerythrin-like domain-containing protein